MVENCKHIWQLGEYPWKINISKCAIFDQNADFLKSMIDEFKMNDLNRVSEYRWIKQKDRQNVGLSNWSYRDDKQSNSQRWLMNNYGFDPNRFLHWQRVEFLSPFSALNSKRKTSSLFQTFSIAVKNYTCIYKPKKQVSSPFIQCLPISEIPKHIILAKNSYF